MKRSGFFSKKPRHADADVRKKAKDRKRERPDCYWAKQVRNELDNLPPNDLIPKSFLERLMEGLGVTTASETLAKIKARIPRDHAQRLAQEWKPSLASRGPLD